MDIVDYINTIPQKDLDNLNKLSYKQYLKTKYWLLIKLWKTSLSGHKCEQCDAVESLEVHHKTYKHITKEYLYLDDIILLCRECHRSKHDIYEPEVNGTIKKAIEVIFNGEDNRYNLV